MPIHSANKYYSYSESFNTTSECFFPEKLEKFLLDTKYLHSEIKQYIKNHHNKESISYYDAQNLDNNIAAFNNLILDKDYIDYTKICRQVIPDFLGDDRFMRLLLTPPLYSEDEFKILEDYAEELRERFDTFVIIGIGGAILNPTSIIEFGQYFNYANTNSRTKKNIKIHYCDYLDSFAIKILSKKIDPCNTAFIVISRSGNTSEVIILTNYWCNFLLDCGIKDYGKHFTFISSTKQSFISKIASKMSNTRYFFYPHDMGGRFSTFTIVGILPGLIAGLDMRLFCIGGAQVFNDTFEYNCISNYGSIDIGTKDVIKSVLSIFSRYKDGCNTHITISYLRYLSRMLMWQSQVFAESLGKEGEGIIHLHGIGPHEQHSQLPIFLDGPRNMLFTVMKFKDQLLKNLAHNEQNFDYNLSGSRIRFGFCDKDLQNASTLCANLTIKALYDAGIDVRIIEISHLSMATLGALMMRSILETVFLGITIGINPYIQPSIEDLRTSIFNAIF